MAEDDGNPFIHETHTEHCPECRLWYAWERGQKIGNKRGRKDLAEKVKEAMENHPHADIWRGEVEDIMDEIIDTLKEKEGED